MRPGLLLALTCLATAPVALCAANPRGSSDGALGRHFIKPQIPPTVLNSYSIEDPAIRWPVYVGVQQTGRLNASFDCRGSFGAGFYGGAVPPGWPRASFESPAGSNVKYLWGAAIWVGGIVGEDTLVSVGADGWSYAGEMFPPHRHRHGSVTRFDYPTDFSMRAEFSDTSTSGVPDDWTGRPHVPLNIRLANRSHIWREEPYDNCILYDLVITNIGQEPINKGYLGLYCDADIHLQEDQFGYQDDLCGAMRSHGIFYGIDNDGDPVYGVYPDTASTPMVFAVKFLEASFIPTDTNFNWWSRGSDLEHDFGPRQRGTTERPFRDFGTGGRGVPEGDVNKYHILAFPEWDYDQYYTRDIAMQPLESTWVKPDLTMANEISHGTDLRFVPSIGPFDLLPDSSIRVFYTMFTADSIHTNPTNFNEFIPEWPFAYLVHLGLERLLPNVEAVEEKVYMLLDPDLPPVGFHVHDASPDSVVLEWDPWVFEGVHGFELRLTEIDPAQFPYPGVIPPWLHPEGPYETIGLDGPYRYVATNLSSPAVYSARLAHRAGSGTGQFSPPVHIHGAPRPAAPTIAEFHYASPGEAAVLEWSAPFDQDVQHYNIYKFSDTTEARRRYLAFYDEGWMLEAIPPADSFAVDGITWYYYAVEAYQQVDGGTTGLMDWAEDGDIYIVTAVDEFGFESEMTAITTVNVVPPPTRDLLVVTNSNALADGFTPFNTIRNFYEAVLSGLDYDLFNVTDKCPLNPYQCPTLHDLTPYRMVIVDDGIFDNLPFREVESTAKVYTRYLQSGGRLAYFGAFSSFMWLGSNSPPGWHPAEFQFANLFFAIDSIFYVGVGYFLINRMEKTDTLFAFHRAETVHAGFPDLSCDTLAYPMGISWEHFWPTNTPPAVAAFKVRSGGVPTHNYRSLYPSTSMVEGEPVGVWTIGDSWETFLFGFHLYYMQEESARDLILVLVDSPTGVGEPADHAGVPAEYGLQQNYPNPFNPATTIGFSLPEVSRVRLSVYNVLGQKIRGLIDGLLPAGSHTIAWDGTDSRGREVATGVYFYRLQAGSFVQGKKMLLIK
jgi:hypothetical protein